MERNKTIKKQWWKDSLSSLYAWTASHVHHYTTHVYHTYIPLYSSSEVGYQAFFITPLVEILGQESLAIVFQRPLGSPFFSVCTFLVLCCLQIHCHLFTLEVNIYKYLVEFISDAIRIRRNLCVCERRF